MDINSQLSDESVQAIEPLLIFKQVSCPALLLLGFYLSKYTQVAKTQCLSLSEKRQMLEMLTLLKQGVSSRCSHFKQRVSVCVEDTVVDAGSSMKTVDARH